MTLLLDLGNTRLKWAWRKAGGLADGGAAAHRGRDLGALLDRHWGDLPVPSAVYAASVAPRAVADRLGEWIGQRWGCALHWAGSQAAAGAVRNGYRRPEQLGVDRWLALCAAWQRVQGAVCVVDCGSAITVDILDPHGQHLGGLIAPGLQMMRDALVAGTALTSETGPPLLGLGRDTRTGIHAGTTEALLGLIERARRQAPADARLVLTGGDASQLATVLDGRYELCPDLVLEGLAGMVVGG